MKVAEQVHTPLPGQTRPEGLDGEQRGSTDTTSVSQIPVLPSGDSRDPCDSDI